MFVSSKRMALLAANVKSWERRQASHKRLIIFELVSEGATHPSERRGVAPRPAPSYPVRPDRSKPQTVQRPILALVPPCRLAPILPPPVARSAALFVHWTSRRLRRHSGARRFSLRPAQRRRRVGATSRTARSKRGISKSTSKGRTASSRHILALTRFRPSIL